MSLPSPVGELAAAEAQPAPILPIDAQAVPAPVLSMERRKPAAPVLAARVLQFQATVLSHATFDEAAAAFATELAALLQFDRAALGFCDGDQTRVVHIPHADFKASAELSVRCRAMDETLDQGTSIAFPAAPGGRPLITLAHAQLSRHYGGAAFSVPLVSRGSAFGALTLARADATPPSADEIALCEHLACIVGPVLELKRESERSWHATAFSCRRRRAAQNRDPAIPASKSRRACRSRTAREFSLRRTASAASAHRRLGAARAGSALRRFLRQVTRVRRHRESGQVWGAAKTSCASSIGRGRASSRKRKCSVGLPRAHDRGQYVNNQAKGRRSPRAGRPGRAADGARASRAVRGRRHQRRPQPIARRPVRRGERAADRRTGRPVPPDLEVDERDVAAVRADKKATWRSVRFRPLARVRVRTVTPSQSRATDALLRSDRRVEDSPQMLVRVCRAWPRSTPARSRCGGVDASPHRCCASRSGRSAYNAMQESLFSPLWYRVASSIRSCGPKCACTGSRCANSAGTADQRGERRQFRINQKAYEFIAAATASFGRADLGRAGRAPS